MNAKRGQRKFMLRRAFFQPIEGAVLVAEAQVDEGEAGGRHIALTRQSLHFLKHSLGLAALAVESVGLTQRA